MSSTKHLPSVNQREGDTSPLRNMLWKKLLKTDKDFIVPPGFAKFEVISDKCLYKVSMETPPDKWVKVTSEGNILREAFPFEIIDTLKGYSKATVAYLKKTGDSHLFCTDKGIGRLKSMGLWDFIDIVPLTLLKVRIMGNVPVVDTLDVVNLNPELVQIAGQYLNSEELPKTLPKTLKRMEVCQKVGFNILLKEEEARRIPPTERQIRDIINTEGGDIFSLTETSGGYEIRFRYRGRDRKIKVDESLRLVDSGMCLNGTDRKHTVDSFLAILKYEDSGEYGHPVYWN